MKQKKKLKYKISVHSCNLWGYTPYQYYVRWERKIIYQGLVDAESRDSAVLYVNRLINVHRRALNGHDGYYAVCMA